MLDLDSIEAQLDSSVPYYLPALIAELRQAKERAAELEQSHRQHVDGYQALARMLVTVAPRCEPLGTVAGVCSQIDNYIAGCHQRAAEDAATIARLDREVVNLQIERSQSDRALATLREATTWQPMSTAPKDGRAFLAATRFLGQPCVERIYWDRGWKGAQGEQRFDAWMPLPPPPPEDQEPR